MNFFKTYFSLFIYKITLDFLYFDLVYSNYNYLGFHYFYKNDFVFFSYFLLIFYAYLYQKFQKIDSSSKLIFQIFFLLYFLPNLTFCTYQDNFNFFIFSSFYCIALSWLYIKLPPINLPLLLSKEKKMVLFHILLFCVIILMVLLSIYYNGFNIKFDFEEVYEIRSKIKDLELPALVNYLRPISSIFISVGLMYYLLKRNYVLSILFFIFGLTLYSFGAHKTDFIILVFTLLIYFFYNKNTQNYLVYLMICFNILLLTFLEYSGEELELVVAGFYVRAFYTPTLLSSIYTEYFSTHEFLYLREHFLHWFDETAAHSKNSPYVIADYYFNDSTMSSNTGLIGSDYAQFGWFSLVFFPILRVYFFKIYDAVTNGLNDKLKIISGFSFAFLFINGAFFTALISGGFLIVCLLFYSMPRLEQRK